MTRGWLAPQRNMVTVVLAAGVLAAGCSASPVDTADAALASHFLEPLQVADVGYSVENTCHLQRDSETEAWHLEVRIQIDADEDRAAKHFEAEDVVVRRDHDPMVIQQETGRSLRWLERGLEARGDRGSTPGVTYDNVLIDRAGDAGGWAEVCRPADE